MGNHKPKREKEGKTMIYAIYEEFFADVEKKLNRVARKCIKNGNPFTFKVNGEEVREIEVDSKTEKTEFFKFILVEVEGTAKIDNWECIAILEIHEVGNIIRRINTEIEVPSKFKHTENFCEHCNSKRQRNNLYIIHNTETNEWKQVGGSCLAQYTNGLNMEYVASYMDGILALEECNGIIGGSYKPYYDVKNVIGRAYEIISKIGYFNADSRLPTKVLVREILYGTDLDKSIDWINKELYGYNIELSRNDFYKEDTNDIVEKIIEYYNSLDDDSEFIHNIKVMLSEGYVLGKNIGFLCYLPQGYAKHIQKEVERAKKMELSAKSDYFGEIGKRYKDKIISSINLVTLWETQFGLTYIYKIILEDCTVLTWKTSNSLNLEKEMENISFTVKTHKEYKGEKQTEVTRCKITYKA